MAAGSSSGAEGAKLGGGDDPGAYRAWFLAEVEKGARSAATGCFAPPQQVAALFARYRRKRDHA